MRIFTLILILFSSTLIWLGFLFRMMHWPAGSLMIVLGFSSSPLAMLLYLIHRYRNKTKTRILTYGMYFMFMGVGVGLTLMQGINATRDLLNQSSDNGKAVQASNETLLKVVQLNSVDTGIDIQTLKCYNTIQRHKEAIVNSFGGESAYDDNGYLLMKDNQDFAGTYFLVFEGGANGNEIQSGLTELYKAYEKMGLLGSVTFKKPVPYFNQGFMVPWVQHEFVHSPLAIAMTRLTNIQNQVLTSHIKASMEVQ